MRPFDYTQPSTLDEAISLLGGQAPQDGHQPQLLAGGTDLLTLMKQEISTPDQLIDIKRLQELDDTITDSPEGVRLGALTTLGQIEDHPLIRESYPALADAAGLAASPQLRNMATIGGNLLQRPRCWYFRSEHVDCWLKGGEDCPARNGENQHHALFGDSPCVAVHPSDLATALLALDAKVNVRGSGGDRTLPLEDLYALPTDERRTEHVLSASDVIVSVFVPGASIGMRSTYLKAMDRKVWAFALVGSAARLLVEEGRITDARLVLGGVAPIPWRVPEAEAMLIGEAPEATLFERAASRALEGAMPLEKNEYKIALARSLVQRALTSVTE